MTATPEDILDRCIEQTRAGGDPERILQEYPGLAGKVRPLLGLVGKLERLPDPSLSNAAMIRTIVGLAAGQAGRSTPRSVRRIRLFSLPVLARAAAMLLVVLGLGWGATATWRSPATFIAVPLPHSISDVTVMPLVSIVS